MPDFATGEIVDADDLDLIGGLRSKRIGAHLAVDGVFRWKTTVTTVSTAGAATYTAAAFAGGIIRRDPNGAGRTDDTPTAAALIAASGLNLLKDGDTAVVYLINTADAAEAITLQAGTGVTITNAGQTIAQNESAALIVRRTSSTAVTVDIVGA